MANYECENCNKEFDSDRREEFVCDKCGGSICAVCVKEVASEHGVAVNKYCPICNNLMSVDM